MESRGAIHDASQVSTALQSEDLAFESLYRLHRPPVYAYALSTVRHAADAEDVTQTTFLNAYCALHRGVAPRDDLQWLLAIARNVCRDRFRDAKRRPKEEQLGDWMRLVQSEEPDYSVREICKQISELSPRYRQVLLLREFEGRSYAEISAQLGVSEQAAQTLLARARRALRDELELGMTCPHARRVALRHLNGVALREERRALQRHLRKCTDCATFVGRTPRTPVAHMLWLVTLPYRRLIAIIVGTAPAGTTAGSSGALAAKLLAITAVGSTALGVTVTEVAHEPAPVRGKQAPARPAAVMPSHHAGAPVRTTPQSRWWGAAAPVAGRAPLTHANHHGTRSLPAIPATSSGSSVVQIPGTAAAQSPPPAAPDTTPSADQAEVATVTPAPAESTPVAIADAGSAAGSDASAASAGAGAASTPSPVDSTAPTAPSGTATTPATPDTSTPATPVTSPPATTPAPPGQTPGRGNGNGNGNGVGQDGTPPGQANKPDPPAHGRP